MSVKLNPFLEWAYKTRGNTVKDLREGKIPSMEKMFLSFMSHNPVFISHGPSGLNGAVKGIGFVPKEEYMKEALDAYIEHIKTYDPKDKEYQKRGLDLLMKYLYSEEAMEKIDFSCVYGIEMAYTQSYKNYMENEEASLVFYQPPVISYELKGKMKLIGEIHDKDSDVSYKDLPMIQQFINAQHDVYHSADMSRWKTQLVYKFEIEQIYDKSATKKGFGVKIYDKYEQIEE